MKNTRFLDIQEIIHIHRIQIDLFGGLHGIRDVTLLESAAHMPQAEYGGHLMYATVFEQAAAYMYHLVKNHPFLDGNKRTGTIVAITFLYANDYQPSWTNEELFTIAMNVASSKTSKEDLITLFNKHLES
jgi:death-on-curing protein